MDSPSSLKNKKYQILTVIGGILLLLLTLKLLFHNISWGMPNKRSPAVDNLVLDGIWAHKGEDLSRANIDLYPPLCYVQMEWVFKCMRRVLQKYQKAFSDHQIAACYIIASRCISTVLTILTGWLVFSISRGLFCIRTAFWSTIFYILNPVTIYYANTSNAEATYIFYFMVASALFLQTLQHSKTFLFYVGFFVAAALSVAAKDQGGFLLLGPSVWLLWKKPLYTIWAGMVGLVLFLAIYVGWGGVDHLFKHVDSMRANSAQFEIYSSHPFELVKLGIDFCLDMVRTFGLAFLFAILCFWNFRDRKEVFFIIRLILLALVPYFVSILFMAHRTYPRYLLPFLPLMAVPAGFYMSKICLSKIGKVTAGFCLVACLIWASLFVIHLENNPQDRSKNYIRAQMAAGELPSEVTFCLFTVRKSTKYSLSKEGTWTGVETVRNWFLEKYGWISPKVKVFLLLPEEYTKLQTLKPILVGIFDSDRIAGPIPGYEKIKEFGSTFQWLFGYVYKSEPFTLYLRNDL